MRVGDTILFGSREGFLPPLVVSNPPATDITYEPSSRTPSLAPLSVAYTGAPSMIADNQQQETTKKNLLVGNFHPECAPNPALPQRTQQGNQTCQYLREGCSGSANIEILVPGRWFSLEGVDGPVTISTCNNQTNVPTLVQVYTTCPDGFGYGSCAPGLTYQSVPGSSHDCEKVSWQSNKEVDYNVLVLALDDNNNNEKNGWSIALEILNNDDCENAIGPLTIGDTFFGIVENTGPEPGNVPRCGEPALGGAVWWHVVGTGGRMTADTCNAGTVMDTRISVFQSNGSSCSDLECVASNDDACGKQSLVSWDSERGVAYYIGVYGKANASGEFDLHIDGDESEFLSNDFCDQAQEIVVGSGEEVNRTIPLTDAKVDTEPFDADSYCYGTANDYDRWGVWYWIRAANGSVRVSVESPNSDPWLTAFTGEDCEDMMCWLDTFDAQTKAGTIPAGQRYRVYVHYSEPQAVTSAEVVLRIEALS